MPKSVHIVLSLSIVCLISGLSLSWLNAMTKERIELQVLENKQMPAVRAILGEAENDLLKDRRSVTIGDRDVLVFTAKKGDKPYAIALETSGKGFGGDVGVMIGFDLTADKLAGVGITTMSETPGVGTRAKEDSFTKQFKNMDLAKAVFKVKSDGGTVDAVTGATVTSRAVCSALQDGLTIFKEHKDKLVP